MAAIAVNLVEPQHPGPPMIRLHGESATLHSARGFHTSGHLLEAAAFYRQAFDEDPCSLAAVLGLSLIARQSGQLLPSLHMAQAAVAIDPLNALAHCTLAHGYLALHELALAESHFRESLRLNHSELPSLLGLAELLTATSRLNPERLATAKDLFHRVLVLRPTVAAAHFGMGNILALEENYTAALASFECGLTLDEHSAVSGACIDQGAARTTSHRQFAVAYAHAQLGQHEQAIRHYREAIALQPNFASAWLNMGVSLIADGRDLLGESCYHQAIAVDSTLFQAHLNLGNLARSRRLLNEAAEHYERAHALQPENSAVHIAFAYLHLDQGDFPAAHAALQDASKCNLIEAASTTTPKPTNPEIPNALGILLLAEAAAASDPVKTQAAIDAFVHAESLGHKTAASNRGNALLRLGCVDEALAAHRQAVALDPNHPGARYNLALTQIRCGDYTRGWANYEARWSFREVHPRPRRFAQPIWKGEFLHRLPMDKRRILIYCEQGLGDTIQFLRYLPLVAERGAEIIIEVQPPLARLLRPFVEGIGITPGQLLVQGEPLPDFDLHCPLMSLPAVFGTSIETVPGPVPYLNADPKLKTARARDLGLASQLPGGNIGNIGLSWAGNPNYPADRDRSTHLGAFLPLFLEFPETRFVSLQKGDAARQIHSLPAELAPLNASGCDIDLAGTAALIANLDMVITTDTVIAHLAGAMGKPLWLLLPWQSDWRWGQDSLTTPWYPQARLFRQSSAQNWKELIQRVIHALRVHSIQCLPTKPADFLSESAFSMLYA